MKITDWIVAAGVLITIFSVYGWVESRDREALDSDGVTDCQPPRNEGEKLVATLRKNADGGALMLHCAYHTSLSLAP